MAGYKVRITNEKATPNVIELSTNTDDKQITSLKFKMNTLDDQSRNRADCVRCEFEITGEIIEQTREVTRALAEWSKDRNRDTVYRDVRVEVYDSVGQDGTPGRLLRKYRVSDMFVIDYFETFGDDTFTGTFKLWIAQVQTNHNIEILTE